MLDTASKDASLVMLRDASMGAIFGHLQRPRARHCYLQCSVHLSFLSVFS